MSASAAMVMVMAVAKGVTGDLPGTWSIAVAGTLAAAATVRYMRSGLPVVPRSTKAAHHTPDAVASDG